MRKQWQKGGKKGKGENNNKMYVNRGFIFFSFVHK